MQATCAGRARCLGSPFLPYRSGLQPRRGGPLPCQPRQARQARQQQRRIVTRAGLRAVEGFDGSYTLDTASQELLFQMLKSETFRKQVVQQCGLPEGTDVEFTGLLFQPVPWSPTTKRGMPAEFERYLEDGRHTVINVPPNYMFQAKIFKPSRLCAIFEHVPPSAPPSGLSSEK